MSDGRISDKIIWNPWFDWSGERRMRAMRKQVTVLVEDDWHAQNYSILIFFDKLGSTCKKRNRRQGHRKEKRREAKLAEQTRGQSSFLSDGCERESIGHVHVIEQMGMYAAISLARFRPVNYSFFSLFFVSFVYHLFFLILQHFTLSCDRPLDRRKMRRERNLSLFKE